ncbi:dihydroorotate dehydrogenase electron transfer subunit [Falsibacillus albus]|uniref:Dihydroorotate dehydrogenase B (NAD(+)), electron transfer subunit n=1 Tax=Falsibacillus albus TaxID=2478915 RepID=A0A3L7JYI4_9BACI|nr:dihydroorotate dehydrogenase electron transfer subunit [Falsibacillus albus]RLQ95803.1 dihydroorotate dehydrogenase electron transfer subunit [Falsibacillus albus]
MIKQEKMTITCQREIAASIYELTLEGQLVDQMVEPGQFVHLRVSEGIDPLLRRPISISKIHSDRQAFTMIYRAEGKGTQLLSEKQIGDKVDVLGPLGHGFPIEKNMKGKKALLVGGGIGVPPLYELSHRLLEGDMDVVHVLGFQNESSAFYIDQFSQLGDTYAASVDGTVGTKGFVTNILDQLKFDFDVLYACGPTPMLKALEERFRDKRAYLSLEQRMGCGIGACFACVCAVKDDPEQSAYRKVCSDGPVFPIGEVVL